MTVPRQMGHREVLHLAVPIVLSNLSIPLLGAVGTAVIGHLPEVHFLGGVAVGAQVFTLLFWGFGFLRMATTGFTAQAYGAADAGEVRATLARALMLASVCGLGLILLQTPLFRIAIALMEPSNAVAGVAREYLGLRVWAAPATLINIAFLGWFIGLHDTRTGLILQLWMNGLNIALAILFVQGFGWNVPGVALADVGAEWSAVALGLFLAWRKLGRVGGSVTLARLFDRDRLLRLFVVNRDIFIRTLCLLIAFFFFTAQGARSGDVVLAANAVLMNFQSFMSYGLDGFAQAAEAMVGGGIGRRDRAAVINAVRLSTMWAGGVALCYAIAYWAAGELLIDALTGQPAVRAAAMDYLPWLILSPLLSVWSFQLDGIFIGAVRSGDMVLCMLISVAAYLAVWALVSPFWGNHGLWFAFMVFMAVRAITLGWRFPRILTGLR